MKKNILFHLRHEIKTSIEDDIIVVLQFHEQSGGGFHSIPRHIFSYIDYLGRIRYGTNSTKNANKYISEYLGKANPVYKERGMLLYVMWRHGTLHEYDPKILRYKDTTIGWLTNISSRQHNKRGHLNVYEKDKSDENIKSLALKINLQQLADDLLSSVDILIGDITKNVTLRERVQKYFDKVSEEKIISDQQETKCKSSSSKPNKELIDQFKKAEDSICGKVDSKGNVTDEWN